MASLSLLDDPPDFFLSKEYAELMSHEFIVWIPWIGLKNDRSVLHFSNLITCTILGDSYSVAHTYLLI
jgi:hypothetical protein